jgi:hypothetical protein
MKHCHRTNCRLAVERVEESGQVAALGLEEGLDQGVAWGRGEEWDRVEAELDLEGAWGQVGERVLGTVLARVME